MKSIGRQVETSRWHQDDLSWLTVDVEGGERRREVKGRREGKVRGDACEAQWSTGVCETRPTPVQVCQYLVVPQKRGYQHGRK
jgi:hypothetical protein